MSLKFNTYRAKRYLRSRFVEGKYLLASEASDLQLESLQVLRKAIEKSLGSAVAIDDAWKVELLSSTQILIKPGQAWVNGLPVEMRSGRDQLVSGAVLTIGIVPVGVSVSDEPNGQGKILTFNDGATTPTNVYRLIVSAQEELITDADDPFLKNLNLTESTAQKIRLVYKLNLVPTSLQSNSPVPYRDEISTSLVATNFPNTGGFASPNLVNEIVITPVAAGNGELISATLVTGSEGIDGRDVELVVRNDSGLGGIILPNSPTSQQSFANSTLIDSNGNVYHVNAIFNDTVSTQLVLRVDKEVDQPNPEIINGLPFTLLKKDVFVTDDINGSPQGKLYWHVAELDWNQSTNFNHESKVADLRDIVLSAVDYQNIINKKINIIPTGGGNISFGVSGSDLLTWTSDVVILDSFGPSSAIQAGTAALVEEGSLVYDLDLQSGGVVSLGSLIVTILTGGSTLTMGPLDDLSSVRVGNIIKIGSEISQVTAINNLTKQLQVIPAITGTGSATVYLDSFANNTAVLSEKSYVLAVRKNNKVWVGGGSLELEDGETNQLGDGVPKTILDFIGAVDELDDSPNYSSTTVVTQGGPLTQAISELDSNVGDINDALATPLYDEVLSVVTSSVQSIAEVTDIYGSSSSFFNSANRLEQPFIPSISTSLYDVTFYIGKGGVPDFNIFVDVYTNSGGVPGTLLGTSTNSISASSLTGVLTAHSWNFSGLSVVSGNTYHFVIRPDNFVSSGNLDFRLSNTYVAGNYLYSSNSGTVWVSGGKPLTFIAQGISGVGPNEIAGPILAGTPIYIPNNTRDGGNSHFYEPGSGDMIVLLNQLIKTVDVDYTENDSQTVIFLYDIPVGYQIRFRDAVIGGGSTGGGGGTSLQNAYNVGRTITVTPGNPLEISGSGGKLLKINGDIEVTGVIDPTGVELIPQNTNPLGENKQGFWINLQNQLILEDGESNKNLSQVISDIETGTGVTSLTRLLFNGTGLVIPKGTPVYSPSAGQIAPASGSALSTANVLGVAAENIAPSTNGKVSIMGVLSGMSGFTHNSVLYLDSTAGALTQTKPTIGSYPSGFVVFIVGIMEGTNLYIRPQFVGIL